MMSNIQWFVVGWLCAYALQSVSQYLVTRAYYKAKAAKDAEVVE